MIKKDMFDLDYIDSFMIVDKHFDVVFTRRYNPRYDGSKLVNDYSDYINKNFFEIYPNLDIKNSTMYECIKKGNVVQRNKQYFKDYNNQVFSTSNITIPINRKGEIIGAIELSKDLTSFNDLEEKKVDIKVTNQESELLVVEEMTFDDILTSNIDMIDNIRKAKVFGNSPNPMLIYGETGTGKELFVQAMVNYSNRSREKFVVQNCAAVPNSLMESMLFGSVKGAYTGAENRIGLFEEADGGTLFLDELNSMPYEIQSKLLRVLQDNQIRPIGSNKVKKVDVKVIFAMNEDPMKAIEEKKLREDLFYRVSGNMIKLVPLRDRKEDILLYANYYIKIYNYQYSSNVEGISRDLMNIFKNYAWKGNVRELKHIIESMVSITEERLLTIKSLPIYMKDKIEFLGKKKETLGESYILKEPIAPLKETLIKAESEAISKALYHTNGHINKAAEMLGVPRQTLKYRMDKLNIDRQFFKKKQL